MTSHRAPDEITAAEIIAALRDVAPDAHVEQTGGNVATIYLAGDALAIGMGSYDYDDPGASVFPASFDTTMSRTDRDDDPYIFIDWTDERIAATARQAIYDLTLIQ